MLLFSPCIRVWLKVVPLRCNTLVRAAALHSHDVTNVTKKQRGEGLNFRGHCGNFSFYPFVILQFVLEIVCIYYTRAWLSAELNFVAPTTLPRFMLVINPEAISSNQDTGTNWVTACQTYLTPSSRAHLNNSTRHRGSAQRLDPFTFETPKPHD